MSGNGQELASKAVDYSKTTMAILTFSFLAAFFVSVLASCNRPRDAVFKKEPTDAIVEEGQNTNFSCTISDFNSNAEAIYWEVQPNWYRSALSFYYDKNTSDLTSIITIFNVSSTKHILLTCILQVLDSQFFLETCSSRSASLTMEWFPRDNDLTCAPSGILEADEGDTSYREMCSSSR